MPYPVPSLVGDVSQLEPSPPHDRTASHDARARSIVLGLFAASGCAALIYQVTWLEQLTLAIGSSALSLGVLLATFMGGLCLGSLLASRAGAASHVPLARYAFIEAAGVCASAAWLSRASLRQRGRCAATHCSSC
jgi:hypothetical protein